MVTSLGMGRDPQPAQDVAAHALWGRDLSPVDAHLVGSVLLVPGARLRTRDKRLYRAAEELEVSYVEGTADLYADGPPPRDTRLATLS